MTDTLPAVVATPPVQAEVSYRIAHVDYPMRTSTTCGTCNSIYRPEIEHMVLMGFGWKKIAEALPRDAGLNAQNLKDHWGRGHMPLPEGQRRAVIERRARFKKVSTMDADLPLVDPWIVHNAVMQKGFERLMTGAISPTVSELIAAARAITDLEREAKDDQMLNGHALAALVDSARLKMDSQKFMEWCIEMQTNPIMNLYQEQQEDVTDAEVIEEGQTMDALPPVADKAERTQVHVAETQDALPPVVDGAEWVS